jgi:hypothetical protein
MKRFFVMVLCLGLAACSTPPVIQTVTETKVVTPDIPASLLSCMGEPAVPAMTLQSQVADWLVADEIAGQDCRLHLAAVKQALAAQSPAPSKNKGN